MQSSRFDGGSSANILLGLGQCESTYQPTQHPHERIGLAACRYARQIVVKSASALESNTLSNKRFAMLREGIEQMRAIVADLKLCPAPHALDPDVTITSFINVNAFTRKYSLGNCFEYACLALEYVYQRHLDVEAEVFNIHGGDHIFLVIGHQKTDSFIYSDPLTWGDSAYICDPWLDKVYPAAEYKTKLHNYYLRQAPNERSINVIEPLQAQHVLAPYKYEFNSRYLAKQETPEYKAALLEVFKRKVAIIQQAAANIRKKIKQADDTVKTQFKSVVKALATVSCQTIDVELSCEKIRESLESALVKSIQEIEQLVKSLHHSALARSSEFNSILQIERRMYAELSRRPNSFEFDAEIQNENPPMRCGLGQ